MYRAFTVQNFRCFQELTVEPLERLNLIAGMNNVGKTALLEALWIHHGADTPNVAVRVNHFRGLIDVNPKELIWELFTAFRPDLTIELSATGDWGQQQRSLRVYLRKRATTEVPLSEARGDASIREPSSSLARASDDEIVFEYADESVQERVSSAWLVEEQAGPAVWTQALRSRQEQIPGRPIGIFLAARRTPELGEEARRFSRLAERMEDDDVLKILKEIEPRLRRLVVLATRSGPTVVGDIGLERLVPVALMGDGMGRLLSLAVSFGEARGGIVLIDEVENGLHHTVMVKVWKGIADFARKFDVQVFATTHSLECIRSAHQAFEQDEKDDFRLHRLESVNGVIRSVTYDRDTLGAALEADLEVH